MLRVGLDDVGDSVQNSGALVGRDVAPGLKGIPSCAHGLIHILTSGLCAVGQKLPVGGTAGLKRGPVLGGDPLSADIEIKVVLCYFSHGIRSFQKSGMEQ